MNLDVMIATISVAVVMAAIMLIAVIVLVGLIVRFILHKKPRVRNEQIYKNVTKMTMKCYPNTVPPLLVTALPC